MQKVKNDSDNFENDISRLLGSMKQVAPPGDFDVRVRSRIAKGKPSVGRSWFPAAASVAATVLVVAAAGYFGLRSYYSPTPVQQATIAPVPVEKPAVQQPVSNANPPPVEPPRDAVASTLSNPGSVPSVKTPEVTQPKPAEKQAGGGSVDFTSGIKKPILPRGLNANPKINASSFQQGGVQVNDMLKQLGLDAVSENSGWRVKSVSDQAARSGLKAGDVIEAMNGRSLVKKTSLSGTVSGKTLRVRRDGKTVEITLAP